MVLGGDQHTRRTGAEVQPKNKKIELAATGIEIDGVYVSQEMKFSGRGVYVCSNEGTPFLFYLFGSNRPAKDPLVLSARSPTA